MGSGNVRSGSRPRRPASDCSRGMLARLAVAREAKQPQQRDPKKSTIRPDHTAILDRPTVGSPPYFAHARSVMHGGRWSNELLRWPPLRRYGGSAYPEAVACAPPESPVLRPATWARLTTLIRQGHGPAFIRGHSLYGVDRLEGGWKMDPCP